MKVSPVPFFSKFIVILALALSGTVNFLSADTYANYDPSVRAMLQALEEKYKSGKRYLPGYEVKDTQSAPGLPRVYAPTRPTQTYTKYKWHENIVATIFWVGELPTKNNPVPNTASSWDTKWMASFGGYDDPNPSNRAWDFRPKAFIPQENPFYFALPYNDLAGWAKHKSTAKQIPWHRERFRAFGKTILKGQWIAIRYGSATCYAQWEDCGPFLTDDFDYVFGHARPKTTKNGGAGIDISPAVRDFLRLRSGGKCDWRFVDLDEVPTGPWRKYGNNNPFVKLRDDEAEKRRLAAEARKQKEIEHIVRLRENRDAYIQGKKP